jgi:hypothetical protein
MAALGLVAATAPAAHAASAPWGALSHSQANALAANETDRVIVVFRDQESALPDTAGDQARRAAAVGRIQHSVLDEMRAVGAKNLKSLTLINAVTATVSKSEAAYLATDPAVQEVAKDEEIKDATPSLPATPSGADFKAVGDACAAKGKVQLNPEAIESIHAASQSGKGDTPEALGYTGAGVKVAFIADGLDIDNPDFIRADGKHVFVDYQDFSGTGTSAPTDGGEAYIDSSSIAAQGREVYNLDNYGTGLTTPCLIRVRGVAPGASLVGLDVFGDLNEAYNSVFLEAINYAVNTDHVKVLNESFGFNAFPDTSSLDLTKLANDAATAAGVTVTVSSGDSGPTDTIGSPSTDPDVISAGATTTYRAYAQTDIGGISATGVKGWVDNNISGLSSGGFDQSGATVDVVAPGDLNWTLCTPDPAKYAACTNFAGKPASVQLSGGTSEAAPLTAGVAALVIQAYAKHHGGKDPSPAVVKKIIVSTTENISAPADQQGAGLVDAYQAVLAAASYGNKTRTGHTLLDSATQLNALGAESSSHTFSETLTNEGSSKATVGLSSRTLAAYSPVSAKTLTLKKADGYATTVTFTVPSHEGRLNAAVALVGGINLSLINPSHKLAEYNLAQGTGNYGDAQVTDPAAGTWTALISDYSGSGASVTAHFAASVAAWTTFGTLSTPSLSIPAGSSASFTLTASTPSTPGDQSGSILVDDHAASGFTAVGSIPVTLRSLVPTPDPSTSFTGTLTGGNGRATNTGQTAYYQVQVPAGRAALNAEISTADSANTFVADLVAPDGQVASSAANDLAQSTNEGGQVLTPEDGAALNVLAPAAGTWTLIIDFYNTVSGTATSQPFDVTLNDTPVSAGSSGFPDSTSTQLTAGTSTTVEVEVTNDTSSPEEFFTDARLAKSVTEDLSPVTVSQLTLPNVDGVLPLFLVPSHTTSISSEVTASKTLIYDMSYEGELGDPQIISSTGKTAKASFSGSPVADGLWSTTPFLKGPDGAKGFKDVTATLSMKATTAEVDPSVRSATGDLWATATSPTAGFSPYVVEPGQSTAIPVTITPEGKAGTVVTGTVYLDSASYIGPDYWGGESQVSIPEASDVAAFPYTYTIKS